MKQPMSPALMIAPSTRHHFYRRLSYRVVSVAMALASLMPVHAANAADADALIKELKRGEEAKRSLPEGDFGEGIRIVIPTAAYLLAMKLRACRPPLPGYAGDYGDIRFLVQKMGIGSAEEAEAIHDKFFPHDALTAEAREVVKGAVQART